MFIATRYQITGHQFEVITDLFFKNAYSTLTNQDTHSRTLFQAI